jgi:dCTP deaminase
VAEDISLGTLCFSLASTVEYFKLPNDIIAFVHDKSTWARRGLSLFNTVIEPGWEGFLTLELMNNGFNDILMKAGTPIAQIIFVRLEEATDSPYAGRYQKQEAGPQPARFFGQNVSKES